jgi:hypothetical protein
MSREDWRRENVDAFIERVYRSIKNAKPPVKFGVSPRGIWRPGNPPQIKGTDAYAELYADSRKWLAHGWVDYLAPQLYWARSPKEQSFGVLLNWWVDQNPKHRHLWPGIAIWRARQWSADEIPSQVQLTRDSTGASGYILYNASSLMQNASLSAQFSRTLNIQPALVPPSRWLVGALPGKPIASVSIGVFRTKLSWSPAATNSIRWWLVQTKDSGEWKTELLPSTVLSKSFSTAPDVVSVSAIDRAGNLSSPAVLQLKESSPAPVPKEKPLPRAKNY